MDPRAAEWLPKAARNRLWYLPLDLIENLELNGRTYQHPRLDNLMLVFQLLHPIKLYWRSHPFTPNKYWRSTTARCLTRWYSSYLQSELHKLWRNLQGCPNAWTYTLAYMGKCWFKGTFTGHHASSYYRIWTFPLTLPSNQLRGWQLNTLWVRT